MKSDDDLAALFAALGHPSRISILRGLLARGGKGCSFGELAQETGIAASTLTHHLREMQSAAIVQRTPMGRSTQLRLDLGNLLQALSELSQICCTSTNAPPPFQTSSETET